MLFPQIARPLKEFFYQYKKQKKAEESSTFLIKMAQKREVWSEKECSALLSAYGMEKIQKKLGGTHKNADIYRKISDIMKKRHTP
jgi:hypothetical protein